MYTNFYIFIPTIKFDCKVIVEFDKYNDTIGPVEQAIRFIFFSK
jgi:hypothetical protein